MPQWYFWLLADSDHSVYVGQSDLVEIDKNRQDILDGNADGRIRRPQDPVANAGYGPRSDRIDAAGQNACVPNRRLA